MATQTVEFRAASGATLTAKLFSVGSDSVVQTASAVTEATNRKGTYAATFTDPGAAEFELVAFSGAIPVCRWFVTLTLTTATFQAYEVRTQSVVNRVTANTDQWNGVTVTGMPMPTYTQPAGFLGATFPATVASTTNITQASGVVLAATTHTGARIPNVTLVDTTTTNTDMRGTDNALLASSYTAPLTAAGTAAAVWDALLTTYTTAGTFGARILRTDSASAGNGAKVTGAGHVASDIHELQDGVITAAKFAADAITNVVLADSAINEIRTGIRTELATELARMDVSVSSRLAFLSYTAPDNASIAAVKAVTDKLNSGLVADGAVYQFTANMLELAPAGGGGGGSGDATLANQVLILDQLDVIQNKTDLISGASGITSLLAGAVLDPGSITSFPEVLTVGDSYTEANGRAIQIPIVDTNGVPISSTGSLYFSSATVTFVIKRAGETDSDRIISGTATFVDPPGTGTGDEAPYAVIELLSSETSKGLMKYKYTGILTFTWPGTSDEVMSFETNTITFRE